MSDTCRDVRRRLLEDPADPGRRRDEHLASCAACARFAERTAATRRFFRDQRAAFEPDGAFATRVIAQLPAPSVAAWSWAVARVLPATVALLAVLVWLSWRLPAASPGYESSPTDDVLAWVIEQSGDGR